MQSIMIPNHDYCSFIVTQRVQHVDKHSYYMFARTTGLLATLLLTATL